MYVFGRIDEKGRLQLEKKVRDKVGIEPNSEVSVEVQNKSVVIRPVQTYEEALKHLRSLRIPGTRDMTLAEMKEEARKAIVDNL